MNDMTTALINGKAERIDTATTERWHCGDALADGAETMPTSRLRVGDTIVWSDGRDVVTALRPIGGAVWRLDVLRQLDGRDAVSTFTIAGRDAIHTIIRDPWAEVA